MYGRRSPRIAFVTIAISCVDVKPTDPAPEMA
jgi:hypothetical protein